MVYKRSLAFCVSLTLVLILPSCLGGGDQKEQRKNGLVVINVLDKKMYDDCHIRGSINVPFDQIERCEVEIEKDAEVVVYCSNYQCTTSEFVAKKLKEKGFNNVCVYRGGTAEWMQSGYPVDGPSQQGYLKRHIAHLDCDEEYGVSLISANVLAQKMNLPSRNG